MNHETGRPSWFEKKNNKQALIYNRFGSLLQKL